MKLQAFRKSGQRFARLALAVIGAFALLTLISANALPAFAQDPGGGAAAKTAQQALSNYFKREQIAAANFQTRLEAADKISAKLQEWIDKASAAGKDTSTLQAGLTAFNNRVAAVKASLDQVNGLIASHTGFDGAGNVTNAVQALETVKVIRQQLRDANLNLRQAVIDLRQVIVTYRQANH